MIEDELSFLVFTLFYVGVGLGVLEYFCFAICC